MDEYIFFFHKKKKIEREIKTRKGDFFFFFQMNGFTMFFVIDLKERP